MSTYGDPEAAMAALQIDDNVDDDGSPSWYPKDAHTLIMANTMVAGATKKPALPTTSSGGEPQPTAEDWEQVEFTDYTTTPTTTASEADPVSPTATERSHWWQGVGLVRGAGFAVTVGPATPVVALSGALVGSMIGMIKDQNGRSAYEIMQELGYDDKIAFLVRLYDEFGRRYATLDFTSPVDLGDAGGRHTFDAQGADGLDPVDDYHIRGTPGAMEMDSRFKIHNPDKFRPSAVFKVLWDKPSGAEVPGGDISDDEASSRFGQRFNVGFRRFIVVANDEGHCTSVPILTYEQRGCKKRGVNPRLHGIAYQAGTKPRLLVGEPELGFNPISIELDAKDEHIAKESRVNYAKLVTVEHNVKVYFIGHVSKESYNTVCYAVGKIWYQRADATADGDI